MSNDPRENELAEAAKVARAALHEAEKVLEEYRLAKAGVAVGEIVRTKKNGEVKVSYIRAWPDSKAWVSGHVRKANGDWSKAVQNFFTDWSSLS